MKYKKDDIIKIKKTGKVGVIKHHIIWSTRYWVWFPGIGEAEVDESQIDLIHDNTNNNNDNETIE